MSLADKLADELIKEILTPPLLVPDDLFADGGCTTSPFSRATWSASNVLLVCKRWMRVATPALYHTVVIRSTAQAQALAAALTRNPEFGTYVRKLRVEGAFGEGLGKVALFCPNITDFCCSLSIWADSGSVGGLLKVLSAINPRRVFLTLMPEDSIKNKKHTAVVEKLCSCIPLWTNLEVFCFSGEPGESSVKDVRFHPSLATALSSSVSLKAVHCWLPAASPVTLADTHLSSALSSLASRSSITFYFHLDARYGKDLGKFKIPLPERLRSQARTVWHPDDNSCSELDPEASELACPNPFYVPLSTASDSDRTRIWTLIFAFALGQKNRMERWWWWQPKKAWYDEMHWDFDRSRSALQLSHPFRRIVVPLLCRHLCFSNASFATLHSLLREHKVPSTAVETLRVDAACTVDVTPVLSHLTQLRDCIVPLSPRFLKPMVIVARAGNTLKSLTLLAPPSKSGSYSLKFLFLLTSLTSLCFKRNGKLKWSVWAPVELPSPPPRDALAMLTSIEVGHEGMAIWVQLAKFALPNLQVRSIECGRQGMGSEGRVFLQRHGHKLKKLRVVIATNAELDLCPAVEELKLGDGTTYSDGFASESSPGPELPPFTHGHQHLRVLELFWERESTRHHVAGWEELFKLLTRDRFPALQKVIVQQWSTIWPTSE
ncbi:hypothetical protein EXIGLDRAFT_768440 [Exidia glandulosa HHB12029]|uniref:Uncharacterized protein n=1 Tax=Exidia glandulosa HHB12029 TaxID=1314781 RepID=A0A165I7B8_EXIGL|nr:hypothetical protein EXIGLDRAFT_768440 [Exidia glandulosa HHB12029]